MASRHHIEGPERGMGESNAFGSFMLDLWAGLRTIGWVLWLALKPLGQLSWKALRAWPFWKRVILHGSSVAYAVIIAIFLGLFGLTREYTPPDDVDLWAINRPPSVTLLDREGNNIGTRGSHYGEPVALTEMPDYLINSFVSTEDRRFFNHHGFDPRGFLRAAITNIRSGRMREGASTITQQLARNLFLSSDKTVNRKLMELHLATWLETHYTKEEILSLYLNRTYLGSGAYGVEAASNLYFNKSARELTLPEAAMLAGLPKAPSSLSPRNNLDGAQRRAREVIGNLVETKSIDRSTAEIAKAAPPEVQNLNLSNDFGYYVDYVLSQTAGLLGGIDQDIVITTSIDSSLQEHAIQAVKDSISEETSVLGAEQAALMAYRNDGSVAAMVGGRSYKESQFNRATQAMRQPGSAFKPFVFLTALENGMHTRTLFIDQPTMIEQWRPRNYTRTYSGPMRMNEAMANSINSIAVQASETVGRTKVVETARRLGITRELKTHPSLALGAMEVTLSELTSAYLSFARNGLSATPYTILKIENRAGELLYEHELTPESQIFSKSVSSDMTHLMHQVMLSGTGKRAKLGSRDAAGKTGTTNNWKDAWFIGYTADLTAGTWVGNDENRSMDKVTGGSLPAEIWRNFMLAAHTDLPEKSLSGAYPAQTSSETMRIVEYYNGLQDDFSLSARGQVLSQQPSRSRTKEPQNNGVVGRVAEEGQTPQSEQAKRRNRGLFRKRGE